MKIIGKRIILTAILTLGYIYPFSTLADTPIVMMQLVTVDSGVTQQDLIDKYGKEAVDEYFQ